MRPDIPRIVALSEPSPSRSPLVDANVVARYLGVGRSTVYEMAKRDELPHRRIGNRVKFRMDEIYAWDDSRRRGPNI